MARSNSTRSNPRSASGRRSGNPANRSSAASSSPLAGSSFHDRSRALVVWLSRLPKLVIPAAMLVSMVVGLAAPLVFALPALAVVVVFVGWLALLSWPVLDASGRFVRGLMLSLVIGAGVARVQGWL